MFAIPTTISSTAACSITVAEVATPVVGADGCRTAVLQPDFKWNDIYSLSRNGVKSVDDLYKINSAAVLKKKLKCDNVKSDRLFAVLKRRLAELEDERSAAVAEQPDEVSDRGLDAVAEQQNVGLPSGSDRSVQKVKGKGKKQRTRGGIGRRRRVKEKVTPSVPNFGGGGM